MLWFLGGKWRKKYTESIYIYIKIKNTEKIYEHLHIEIWLIHHKLFFYQLKFNIQSIIHELQLPAYGYTGYNLLFPSPTIKYEKGRRKKD